MKIITVTFTNLIEFKHYVEELKVYRKLTFTEDEKSLSVSFAMGGHPNTQHRILQAITLMADEEV